MTIFREPKGDTERAKAAALIALASEIIRRLGCEMVVVIPIGTVGIVEHLTCIRCRGDVMLVRGASAVRKVAAAAALRAIADHIDRGDGPASGLDAFETECMTELAEKRGVSIKEVRAMVEKMRRDPDLQALVDSLKSN